MAIMGEEEQHPEPETVTVAARGEDFHVVQLAGHLFVCAQQNGSCCCGDPAKGRMPFSHSLWHEPWEERRLRNLVHLSFVGCLGPCPVGNVALLQLHGYATWFKDLNDPALIPLIFDYAEAMLDVGHVLPAPVALEGYIYDGYRFPENGNSQFTRQNVPSV